MNDTKKRLLCLIEKEARLSLTELSLLLDVTEENVAECVAELEAERVICGYSTIINWDKIAEEKCNALIEVKVTPQRGTGFDRIADRISRFDEVDSVYLMSGGYDFLVIVNGKSMKEVSSFVFNKLATIEYVNSTATHFVLKKYKDHGIQIQDKPTDKRTNVVL